jgi:hypothetical protein
MALRFEVKDKMTEKPECFVIAPIGAEKSDIRTRSDQILNHVIRPVADECGYKAIRADEISEPGSITTQVINRILEAPMVVADLTGNNANVFYELAVRHAIRKPFVQIIQKGERIPFDVAGIRTIEIDHTNLDSVAAAKEEIKKQMQFASTNPQKIASPISAAIDLASLTQSDDPLKRQLGELLTGVSELKVILDDRLPADTWRPVDAFGYQGLARAIAQELRFGSTVLGGNAFSVVPIGGRSARAVRLGGKAGQAGTSPQVRPTAPPPVPTTSE